MLLVVSCPCALGDLDAGVGRRRARGRGPQRRADQRRRASRADERRPLRGVRQNRHAHARPARSRRRRAAERRRRAVNSLAGGVGRAAVGASDCARHPRACRGQPDLVSARRRRGGDVGVGDAKDASTDRTSCSATIACSKSARLCTPALHERMSLGRARRVGPPCSSPAMTSQSASS